MLKLIFCKKYLVWRRSISCFLIFLSALFLSLSFHNQEVSAQSPKGNLGVQAIGLSRWGSGDVAFLANALVSKGPADVEVAYLPFEFTLNEVANSTATTFDDDPFQEAASLTQSVLPAVTGSFTLTTHLYFHNNDNDNYQAPFRWRAFVRNSTGDGFKYNRIADRRFRKRYRRRCRRNAVFLNELYAWANRNGYAHKLRLVTVPDLEDNAPSRDAYENVRQFIIDTYATNGGAITEYRRSIYIGRGRTITDPVERHGGISVLRDMDRAGNVYSNDGTTIDISDTREFENYRNAQSAALDRGVSVLFWRSLYNGSQRTTPPSERGVFHPFAKGNGERKALNSVLSAYS